MPDFYFVMKQIPLDKGLFTLVDDADFDIFGTKKWYAHKSRNTFYACRHERIGFRKRKMIMLHREILGLKDSLIHCDHKDGNGLNNLRENLRPCSKHENSKNRIKNKNNTTGFKGVYLDKKTGRYRASIRVNNRNINYGFFKFPELAARAYDEAAKVHFGAFAKLNFP